MTAYIIMLVLLSALFHAFWNYLSKISYSPQLFFAWIAVVNIVISILIFLAWPPVIPSSIWVYIIGSAIVHFFYLASLSQAYTSGEISYVYPIARSAPGLIPIFSVLILDEKISLQGVLGISCTLVSVYMFIQPGELYTLPKLLEYLKKPEAIWSFSTLATVTAYSILDKKGMTEFYNEVGGSDIVNAVVYLLAESLLSSILYVVYVVYHFPWREIITIGKQSGIQIFISTLLKISSYSLILYALMTESVSYISAIRQFSVIFVVLLGGLNLGESQLKLRLIAGTTMVIGIFLIAISN